MQTLNFTVREQEIRWDCQQRKPVEGSIGEVFVQFDVDDEWGGMAVMAVFFNTALMDQPEPVVWIGEPIAVPAAALAAEGRLHVGLVGVADEGKRRLTTRRMQQGIPIYPSGGTGGETVDPDPELWEQLLAIIGDVSKLGTLDKSSLVAAINEILRTGGGGSGSGGLSFELGKTLVLKDGILDVNTVDAAEKDNTLPITSAAVYGSLGNIEALLSTI